MVGQASFKAETAMTSVLFTVDVEMWPPDWSMSSAEYLDAFKRFMFGVGQPRDHGLGFQLRILREHGIPAIFFVEPFFASVVGKQALAEVVGIILEGGGDVQLHGHPEWLGRAGLPGLPGPARTRMYDLGVEEQHAFIALGLDWLLEAGAADVSAFRAGSFSADWSTLEAIKRAGLKYDFSVNPAALAAAPEFEKSSAGEIRQRLGIVEVPLTNYRDAFGRLRGLQVGSSGHGELRSVLTQTHALGYPTACILSHSAELLNGSRQKADVIACRRLLGMCRFLRENGSLFAPATLSTLTGGNSPDPGEWSGLPVPRVALPATAVRYGEQIIRRFI